MVVNVCIVHTMHSAVQSVIFIHIEHTFCMHNEQRAISIVFGCSIDNNRTLLYMLA